MLIRQQSMGFAGIFRETKKSPQKEVAFLFGMNSFLFRLCPFGFEIVRFILMDSVSDCWSEQN
jgi:hypothetical protein